jgi:hypothetical protein
MEAKEAKKAEAQAKEEAKQDARGKDKGSAAGTYKGIIRLTIMPPVDSGQLKKLEEHLSQIPDLRLVLISGSIAEGTEIVVSAESPIPLLDILSEIPPVDQVTTKGKTIQITLKT